MFQYDSSIATPAPTYAPISRTKYYTKSEDLTTHLFDGLVAGLEQSVFFSLEAQEWLSKMKLESTLVKMLQSPNELHRYHASRILNEAVCCVSRTKVSYAIKLEAFAREAAELQAAAAAATAAGKPTTFSELLSTLPPLPTPPAPPKEYSDAPPSLDAFKERLISENILAVIESYFSTATEFLAPISLLNRDSNSVTATIKNTDYYGVNLVSILLDLSRGGRRCKDAIRATNIPKLVAQQLATSQDRDTILYMARILLHLSMGGEDESKNSIANCLPTIANVYVEMNKHAHVVSSHHYAPPKQTWPSSRDKLSLSTTDEIIKILQLIMENLRGY